MINNETEYEKSIDVSGCYRQVSDRDTIIAILVQTGNEITGTLKFDNYEIDGSLGKLQGIIEGEILKLKYHFFSEGMNSIMDINYKYKNDSLIRGIGEMRTSGDSSLFIDHTPITYSMQNVLKKVNCKEVNF
jgi:hypothetical protein